MGEVYRARDARLNRDVALKVLPETFAADADRLARFKREAQVLASLSHANIAAIYGVEEAGGVHALVLELVEGPTLADRIGRGRIPVEEALPIARQIADALEAAHEAGVVHRDLKPANVKLRPDGAVKVLDFGLAKPVDVGVGAAGALTASPTITSPAMTERGVILGTAAYMSPEQAKGRPADKRSDVWALGVVLFEMLAGRRPFRGDDTAETLAAVLRADPDWAELPAGMPAGLRRLLRRCLQKDARRRWQHMGDVRLELNELEESGDRAAPGDAVTRPWLPFAAAVVVAALSTTIGVGIGRWSSTTRPSVAATPVAFTLTLAPDERLSDSIRSFGISRDGRYVAYAAVKDERQQLFLRAVDTPQAVALPGTDNATYPVFSPDGASIAFIADGWVKRVSTAGGATTSIAPATVPRGLAWAPGDRIVFTPDAQSGLFVVSASGGTPERLTELDRDKGETNHRWPVALPDGRGVLFAAQRRSRTEYDVEVVSFESRTRTLVREDAFPVQVLETGYLVYFAVNGDTFAAPFDVSRMAVTGPSVPVPERPSYAVVPGNSAPALSPNGTMASVRFQELARKLVVIGRDGQSQELPVPSRNYQWVAISPSGRRIAVTIQAGLSEWDIWTIDDAGEAPLKRLTVNRFSVWPTWESEDAIIYSAFENGVWKLLSRNIDRNEPPRQLLAGLPTEPIAFGWLPDRSLAYTLNLPQQDLYIAKNGEPPNAIPPPDTGQFGRAMLGLSPDGRWLTYASEQSGQRETFVTAFPGGGLTRQLSRDGGNWPVWTRSGSQLFYLRALQGKPDEILRVTVRPDGSTDTPVVVHRGDVPNGRAHFDVFPDGSLLTIKEQAADPLTLQVVVNWAAQHGLTRSDR
jgi:serine/threonine-protein kinase